MKKQEYLQTLYLHLKNIPEEEKQDIVAEYDRHFIEGLKDGRSEEEIAEILGSPKGIARDLSASSAIHTAENEKNSFNIAQAIFAVLGLSILNFILVLGPLLMFITFMILLIVMALFFLAIPFILMFKEVNPDWGTVYIADWFAAIGWFGLGLMILVVLWIVIKWSYILIVKYLKWNAALIKGSGHR